MALQFAGVTQHRAPYVGQWLLSCLFFTLRVVPPVLGLSRRAVLVALFTLPLTAPVAAQPIPESAAVQEHVESELMTHAGFLAQANPSSLTYITLYRPEVFIGWASAWLGPSKTDLGPAWSNLGGGLGVRIRRRIGAEFELSHSLESALRDVDGLHQGVTSITFGSAKALAYLVSGRVQPYVGFGLGLVWEEGVAPTYCDAGSPPVCDNGRPPVAEATYQNNNVGAAFSAGVRIAFTPRLFIKSEFGSYAGLVQRVAVAGGYQF